MFAGQDHKQGVNHSCWPNAELHRKIKTAHSEQIDHQVIQKGWVNPTWVKTQRRTMNRAIMIRKMSPQLMKTITDVLLS